MSKFKSQFDLHFASIKFTSLLTGIIGWGHTIISNPYRSIVIISLHWYSPHQLSRLSVKISVVAR